MLPLHHVNVALGGQSNGADVFGYAACLAKAINNNVDKVRCRAFNTQLEESKADVSQASAYESGH